MRRVTAVVLVAVAALVASACGPTSGAVGRDRRGSWVRIADPSFTADASYAMSSLTSPGDGYGRWTAAGSVDDPGTGATRAAAWTSADGSRWSRLDLDTTGARASEANASARRQGRSVVVGTVITPRGDRDGRIWTSTDGLEWATVDDATGVLGGPGDQELTTVAAGPLGFGAAGVDRAGGRAVPAVWWSTDGTAWRRVGVGTADPTFTEGTAVEGVAVGRAGVVAVGTLDTSGDVDGMAWFSPDGTTWRTVPLGAAGFAGPAEQAVHAVTATDGGFVAVGDDANGERRVAAAWTSTDGITWQRQPPSPDMAELPGLRDTLGVSATSVAGTGPVLAVGGGYALQLWTSPDGRRWARDQAPAGIHVDDNPAMVATDGAAVLVGTLDGRLWFRPAGGTWAEASTDSTAFPRPAHTYSVTGLVNGRGRLVAVGEDSGGAEGASVWVSPDGMAWTAQDTKGAFGSGSVAGVTALGDVLVAAGTVRPAPGTDNIAAAWDSTDDGDTIDAHAWYSTDGRGWARVSDPAAWSGPGDELLDLACPLPGGGVVALGTTTVQGDQDVWAWVSADGNHWERAGGPGSSLLGGPGLQSVSSCASTGSEVLVAGVTEGHADRDGVLWATSDGQTWRSVGGDGRFARPGDDRLRGVAADGRRVVVTAVVGDDLAVYTSTDAGATWQEHTSLSFEDFGLQSAGEVAIAGDRAVLAGYDGRSAGVWVGPAP